MSRLWLNASSECLDRLVRASEGDGSTRGSIGRHPEACRRREVDLLELQRLRFLDSASHGERNVPTVIRLGESVSEGRSDLLGVPEPELRRLREKTHRDP